MISISNNRGKYYILIVLCFLFFYNDLLAKSIEKELNSVDTLGEESDEDSRRIFLRESTVLLKQGEKELDISLNYTRTRGFTLRNRDWSIPISLRFGMAGQLEGFFSIPIRQVERTTIQNTSSDRKNAGGIADVSVGLRYLLKEQDEKLPDIIGLFSFTIPTGEGPDPKNINDISIHSGRWSLSTGVNFVKVHDPIVLFGGATYTHIFDKTVNDIEITPEDNFQYNAGIGFALNNQVSISSQFIAIYHKGSPRNNANTLSLSNEPIFLRTAIAYRIGKGRYLSPSVTFGLNGDATDTRLGISYTRNF